MKIGIIKNPSKADTNRTSIDKFLKRESMPKYIPVEAKVHTPPYRIHRYFARRPWNVFHKLIKAFSKEKDIVLDPFCGGGITIYEGLRLQRRMIGFDINPLSIFIIKNMIRKGINREKLQKDFKYLTRALMSLYYYHDRVECPQKLIGAHQLVDWYELAHVVHCNYCNSKIILSNENKLQNGRYSCPNEKCEGNKLNKGFIEPKNCMRNGYKYLYSVNICPKNKRLVKRVNEGDLKKILNHLIFLKNQIKLKDIEIRKDKIPLNWDRQQEDLLARKNIIYFQDLFTKKNLYINMLLLHAINSLQTSKENYEIFRFIFSDSLRRTNIMTFTNEGWASGKPNAWAKHAYWIPSQFCEVNVLHAFKNSYINYLNCLKYNEEQTFHLKRARSFEEFSNGNKNLLLINDSIENYAIPAKSVDVIITDPPYGSNVQYLELSHFWYVWNRDLYGNLMPNFKIEAVSNRKRNFKGAKTYHTYEENLFYVFKKSFDVLKTDGNMILTFNNKDMRAWLALLISIFRAGFAFEPEIIFQDGIKNYKQTAHTKARGSPYGDFIYVFKKTRPKLHNQIKNEAQLCQIIKDSFQMTIANIRAKDTDKYKIMRQLFLEFIPSIESFVKSNLTEKRGKNGFYEAFNRDFFNQIYKIN